MQMTYRDLEEAMINYGIKVHYLKVREQPSSLSSVNKCEANNGCCLLLLEICLFRVLFIHL